MLGVIHYKLVIIFTWILFHVTVTIHRRAGEGEANFNSVVGYMCHRKSWHYFKRERNEKSIFAMILHAVCLFSTIAQAICLFVVIAQNTCLFTMIAHVICLFSVIVHAIFFFSRDFPYFISLFIVIAHTMCLFPIIAHAICLFPW